jgi:pyrophosphatase PpaX
VKAVLWDLDDTVLDTRAPRMRALRHAYETTVGGWVDPEALWRSHRGGTLEALGQQLLGDEWRRFTVAYRDRYYREVDRARPFDGVPAVLAALAAAGLPMAIVTSKVSWGAIEELEMAGLLGHFAAVVGVDDVDRHKPDPEPIYAAMQRLIVDDPGEVVMIGDSPADMFAARNAGCRSIAALWGTLDRELLLDTGPSHTAATPRDVMGVLSSLLEGRG